MGLFFEGKFYDLLILSPSISELESIPSRLIMALTLYQLGRIDSAIRELAVTVELAQDERDRKIIIKYLQKVMELRSMTEPNIQPIHTQVEKYILRNGHIDDYSVSRLCSTTKGLCDTVLQDLLNYQSTKSKNKKFTKGLLNKLFLAIKHFVPLYVYDDLLKHRTLIDLYINEEISCYPEIDYVNGSTKTILELVSRILSLKKLSSKNVPLSICGLVIKHQIIRGFLAYLENDFEVATEIFLWLVNFFEETSIELFNRDEYLSGVTERLVGILLGACHLMKPLMEYNVSPLSILINIAQTSEKMNLISEYVSGRLSHYFIVTGGLYERLSFEEGVKIQVNDNIEALRLSPERLDDTLRKYIIATSIAANDDHSVINIYQRILWGLLMYGGIHLETFWFFKFIRDFIFLKLEFSPIVLPDIIVHTEVEFNPHNIGDIFEKYENGLELLENIYGIKKSIYKDRSMLLSNDPNDDCYFLIPQVFHFENQLIFSDQYYDEVIQNISSRDFVLSSTNNLTPKRKVKIKLGNDRVQEKINISRELMGLWLDSFQQYHGRVPDEIIEFYDSTSMASNEE